MPKLQSFKKLEMRFVGSARPRTTAETSARMGRIRRHGTVPEMTVRALVSSLGVRYTLKNQDLPGSPDLANRTRKFAIFVHGCFWHRHEACSRATVPKRNHHFWATKFERNVERDLSVSAALRDMGFKVATIWECELGSLPGLRRRLSRACVTR
jgi:DNA mismatch endonuclease, patch repair protein